jgi:hypothetical protein
MNPQFTSWPWKIEPSQKSPQNLLVLGSRGQTVGLLFGKFPEPNVEQLANADLIEQAPLLFAELGKALARLDSLGEDVADGLLVLVKAGGRR